jgi:glycosyltransferase involved in cell wall biosynthesis
MRILFSSHTFYPNLGGLEAVSLLLAREFARAGHEVVVITRTPPGEDGPDFPFALVRRPLARKMVRLTHWADVVFHNNISLRAAWPLLLVRRPWVVAHHIWLPRGHGLQGMKARTKRGVLRGARNIAISRAIADDLRLPCSVIPDPYDDATFRRRPEVDRDRDLVFVGRFVSDKGLPDLLQALVLLRRRGMRPGLTVIGAGPEESAWRRLTRDLDLERQVQFIGVRRGADLAVELNRHRVLVVPSRWNEPFGIVALEGMACGCLVVGSEGGGLKDAIGSAGITYPNGDAIALAAAIEQLLTGDDLQARCLEAASAHLVRHRPIAVAAGYLRVLEAASSGRGPEQTVRTHREAG